MRNTASPRARRPATSTPATGAHPLLFADAHGVVRSAPPGRRVKNLARSDGAARYSVRDDHILVVDTHGYGTLYASDLVRPAHARDQPAGPLCPVGAGVLVGRGDALVRRDGTTEYEIPRSPPAASASWRLALGAEWAPAVHPTFECYASEDGALALTFDGVHFELGTLAGAYTPMTTDVRLALGGRRVPAFVVYPGRGVHVLCGFDPGAQRAEVVCVGRDGAAQAFELEARGLPVRSGNALFVLEPSGAVVRSVGLDGATRERIELPEALRGGQGALHANNGHAVFASADGEALFDLRARVAIDRRLPAKTRAVRTHLARAEARVLPVADAGRARVRVRAVLVDASSKQRKYSFSRHTDGGDGGLCAALAFGALAEPEAYLGPLAGWVSRGVGSQCAAALKPVSLDEALDALARLDAAELSLLHGLRDLEAPLRLGLAALRSGEVAPQLDREAASLLFYVAARLHEKRESAPAGPLVERWRRAERTPEEGAALLDSVCAVASSDTLERYRFGLAVPLAYFAAWAWGRRSEVVFERLRRGPKSAVASENATRLSEPHAIAMHPRTPANEEG